VNGQDEPSSTRWWERAGLAVSAVGCSAIAVQAWHEWHTPQASTMAWTHLFTYQGLFVFWFLYGLRFGRAAIAIGNAVAALLQLGLILIILGK
jgi:hypothetical protein